MAEGHAQDPGYPDDAAGRLELIWGEGFLSPGGPAEVARILGGYDIAGRHVLDIGSGTGGADIALVRNHGAGSVVGVDVEQRLVDLAADRAARLELDDRIRYELVDPGPLPFAAASFDVVFSKDAIIHVADKRALFTEAWRVLRPGGRLLVSDWLRGDGDTHSPQVARFVDASGHDFSLISLREAGEIVDAAGFADVELHDRQDWYLSEAAHELARLRGPLRAEFVHRWGEEATQGETEFWEVLVASLQEGALRPGHVRAVKSTDTLRGRG